DYGVYTVLLDGKPPVAPQLEHEPGADVRPQTEFDGYALETQVGVDYQVGWPRLTKGRHTLTFVCKGKREDSSGYTAGADDRVLGQERADPRAARLRLGARLDRETRCDTGAASLEGALEDAARQVGRGPRDPEHPEIAEAPTRSPLPRLWGRGSEG